MGNAQPTFSSSMLLKQISSLFSMVYRFISLEIFVTKRVNWDVYLFLSEASG